MEDKDIAPGQSRRGMIVGLVALAGVAAGVAGVYGIGSGARNGESAACPGAAALTAKLGPLARGEVAALNVAATPQPLVPLAFARPDGSPATLADFKGRTVLLNLWATWCVPCRKEMPALDALQADLGGPGFEVVSVNIDTNRVDRAASFLDEIKVDRLTRYADHSARIFQDLKAQGLAFGMPTTLVVDRQGCMLASLAGPAEWASEDAKAFVRAAMGG
ncbi:thiol:disulfide interchange protein TlpA [Labrys wisconsinensis]|uniref:Thiol-disulfide isomerase/thioredoxin n=1 Tax=Labrys wisconsinensis TaxID=425677 RepID=A0ABU0J3N7_9HYPH|nr:TlpA disulfide reductase family protein [Labrys wisconsinensis]MDQ0468225.1 thiol-disulfide isomerase/thioredoxin [Labrys wisconsinensis]